MAIPPEHRKDIEAMPDPLRRLLEEELAAGNEIVEVGHSFPAAPVGCYVKLARPVSSRPRGSSEGVTFFDRNSSIYSGEFADEKRYFFILEPPNPPPPEPDMDAIRAGALNELPSSAGGGVPARLRKSCEATLVRADGVVWYRDRLKSVPPLYYTTPSAPSEEASLLFLDVAATPPPAEEGNRLLQLSTRSGNLDSRENARS